MNVNSSRDVGKDTTPSTLAAVFPHDLNSLTKVAKSWGWNADRVCRVLEDDLYCDLKVISYPYTDCRSLPVSEIAELPGLLKSIATLDDVPATSFRGPLAPTIGEGFVYDDARFGRGPIVGGPTPDGWIDVLAGSKGKPSNASPDSASHHAITPRVPNEGGMRDAWLRMDEDQRRIFGEIVGQFLKSIALPQRTD